MVHDLAAIIEEGKARCPSTLRSRVRFEIHDMFQPYLHYDKRQGDPVFNLKAVLLDWSDAACTKVISNLPDRTAQILM